MTALCSRTSRWVKSRTYKADHSQQSSSLHPTISTTHRTRHASQPTCTHPRCSPLYWYSPRPGSPPYKEVLLTMIVLTLDKTPLARVTQCSRTPRPNFEGTTGPTHGRILQNKASRTPSLSVRTSAGGMGRVRLVGAMHERIICL